MSDRPTLSAHREAGFVVLPLWILQHADLTDCDIRVLLILDQIGYREGRRDGFIDVPDDEIGRRIHKSAWSVARSVKRIASLGDVVMTLEAGSETSVRREPLQLRYDRFAKDGMTMTTITNGSVATDRDSAEQICSQYVSSCPTGSESVTVATVEDSQEQICFNGYDGAEQICSSLPISRNLVVVAVSWGSGCDGQKQICSAPEQPLRPSESIPPAPTTIPELIAWLPCATDDPVMIAKLARKIPLWIGQIHKHRPEFSALAIDWIQDAIIASSDKENIVTYAAKLLGIYAAQGGRPDVELAPRPKAVPDETDTVAPARPPVGYSRKTKAERNAERDAFEAEAFKTLFAPKESAHGAR